MLNLLNLITTGLLLGGLYGLLALPLTLVWRTTGMFDFAAGAYVVVAGIVAADVGGLAGVVAGIAVAVMMSLVTAGLFLLFRTTQPDADALVIGLATFGLAIAATAGAQVWLGIAPRFMRIIDGTWDVGGVVLVKGRVLAFVVALGLVILVVLVLSRTSLGLRMRAAAGSAEHAELLGVPVLKIGCGAFVVSGILYGVVGVLTVSTVGLVYSSTIAFSTLALSAAVLLGLRGPGTAFVGGLVLGMTEVMSRGYVSDTLAGILPSVLIILVLVSAISTRGTSMAARP